VTIRIRLSAYALARTSSSTRNRTCADSAPHESRCLECQATDETQTRPEWRRQSRSARMIDISSNSANRSRVPSRPVRSRAARRSRDRRTGQLLSADFISRRRPCSKRAFLRLSSSRSGPAAHAAICRDRWAQASLRSW
jgi:hypothetical protein